MLKKAINFMKNYKLSNFNFRLFIYVLAVTAVGIYSIGNAAEAEGYQLKQIIGLVLSLVVLTTFTLISYKFVFKFYWVIYGVMIFFLLLVMLFGETNLGAKRWIDLGFTQFQPSELAKIFLIIFMATYIYKHQETLNTFKTLATVVVFSIIPIGFIYKQPDLSTTIVIFITFCAIMFLSGVHYKIITGVLVTAIPIVLVVGFIVLQPSSGILADYQYQRIESFLNKDSDSQSSKDDKWQQENSILAIGSGGLTGKGFNDNGNVLSVKEGNFLPESQVLVVGFIVLQPSSGILADYQYQRIESFLNKDSDSQSSKDDKWQQENSILAIGSGGLTGKGFNDNGNVLSVKEGNFLPESHTDFIFAIVGEELGFVGAAAVILLLFAIVVECFITGSRAPTLHGKLFCFGFGVLLGVQSFVNIAVTTMILPNTGLPLPFVSYGLTSLVSMYCGIGIVLNIGLQRNKALV